ncbi:MAG: hypothetical protein AAF092_07060 [Pseudomonadota bacterium]
MLSALLPIGVAMTCLGLAGLVYCIWTAAKTRGQSLPEEELKRQLQRLVAVNLGFVGVAGLGLAVVIMGLVLT